MKLMTMTKLANMDYYEIQFSMGTMEVDIKEVTITTTTSGAIFYYISVMPKSTNQAMEGTQASINGQ